MTTSENTTDREIIITRDFDAPRELVWKAWTTPEHVAKWWGPRGFSTTIEVMDVRPGGEWKHVMRGPDGAEYPNHSVFMEVVEPERIVYSHGGEKKGCSAVRFVSTWTFDALEEGRTRLTMRHVFPSAAERDRVVKEFGAIEGGKQTLQRLSEHLAKEPFVIERTFRAPVKMVWKAITEKEQMKHWYFELEDFRPEVGFEIGYTVRHGETEYPHLFKVTDVVPGKKITYSWRYQNHAGESFVTWELFPEGDKTRLKLTHAGLETFKPDDNPDYAIGKFRKGWTMIVGTELAGYLEKIAPPNDCDFVISRIFAAPREIVWKAWTDPKQMAQWWGPKDFTNSVCELDVRVGGAYRLVMRAPNGNEYPAHGVYREVAEPRRLVMFMDLSDHPESWFDKLDPNRDKTKKPAMDCLQIVTFEDVEGKTELTVRTRFATPEICAAMVRMGMDEGWPESFDRLVDCIERDQRAS
jgi:uncharacterized protein YndB with AHSA1/START domain